MIKNCLMNFMLVLPVFSSDCRGRTGVPGPRGAPGSRRVPGSFGSPKPPGLLGLPRLCGFPGCTKRLGCVEFPGRPNWCYQSLYTCVRFCQDEVAEFCREQKKVVRSKLKSITFLSTSWIPRSKIIWSNWELISRFRCLLASWIPRFDFFKAIWEVRHCKGFKIHGPHSLWFRKRHKNYLSGNCFSLRCKYLKKEFPACCFILKNGNSWMKAPLINRKKSKSRPFFSWFGNSWFPRHLNTKNNHRPLTRLTTIGRISDQITE